MSKVLLLSFCLCLLYCQQEKSRYSPQENSPELVNLKKSQNKADAAESEKKSEVFFAKEPEQPALGDQTGNIFFPELKNLGRLLEYKIYLSYETENISLARTRMLELVERYGYILQSVSDSSSHRDYLTITLRIKSTHIYAALRELTALGKLHSERIDVTDLTLDQYWQQMVSQRSELRNERRNKALSGTPSAANYQQRENALSESEDAEDRAKFEKIKIKDRVDWANIYLTIQGPALPEQIKVPAYQNALIDLGNFFLQLGYILIYCLPIVLCIWLLSRLKLFKMIWAKIFHPKK